MIRGTTAQFKFEIPYDFTDIEYIKVVFWQPGNVGPEEGRPLPIVKCNKENDFVVEGHTIIVELQTEETARFVDTRKGYVQLSATTTNDIRFASKVQEFTVYPIYDDSPIGDIVAPSTSNGEVVVVLDGFAVNGKE